MDVHTLYNEFRRFQCCVGTGTYSAGVTKPPNRMFILRVVQTYKGVDNQLEREYDKAAV